MNYLDRKKIRKFWFDTYIYKNKKVKCIACNGSGYYDHSFHGRAPKCGSCNGTGKCFEKEVVPLCLIKMSDIN